MLGGKHCRKGEKSTSRVTGKHHFFWVCALLEEPAVGAQAVLDRSIDPGVGVLAVVHVHNGHLSAPGERHNYVQVGVKIAAEESTPV
ncbi:hypothetical protein GCM10009856_06140 [Mycolicibacterium llatzerense]